ncbi:fimbrillin family protein [Alistipes sp. OttesenSCG-928-L06]|nr:fimbrillin family protein [Alistipes sp. OttesenSCG-928-L06]
MKKILIAAAVVVLMLSSCANDKEIQLEGVQGNSDAIEFRTISEKSNASSRAVETDVDNITSFTVTSRHLDSNNDVVRYFDAKDITRGEAGDWAYEPLRFWPVNANSGVEFWAYSPASSIHVTSGLTGFDGFTDEISYKVPAFDKRTDQEDFLVAKVEPQSNGVVKLNFQHALSRVLFNAKNVVDGIQVVITEVALTGLCTEGSLSYTDIPSTTGFDYSDPKVPTTLWTTSGVKNLPILADLSASPVLVERDVHTPVLGKTNALMVIPQTTVYPGTTNGDPAVPDYNEEFAVAVSYIAYTGEDYKNPNNIIANETAYFAVRDKFRDPADVASMPFEIGRQYTFNMTFTAGILGDPDNPLEPIRFEVGVGKWEPVPVEVPDFLAYGYFKDDNLKTQIATYDLDGDHMVSYDELMTITNIDLSRITDLKGIEYLTNVTEAKVDAATVTVADITLTTNGTVDISALVGLETLTIDGAGVKVTVWQGATAADITVDVTNATDAIVYSKYNADPIYLQNYLSLLSAELQVLTEVTGVLDGNGQLSLAALQGIATIDLSGVTDFAGLELMTGVTTATVDATADLSVLAGLTTLNINDATAPTVTVRKGVTAADITVNYTGTTTEAIVYSKGNSTAIYRQNYLPLLSTDLQGLSNVTTALDGNGQLTLAALQTITAIDLSAVTDFSGLEYLTGVTEATISGTAASYYDISKLASLDLLHITDAVDDLRIDIRTGFNSTTIVKGTAANAGQFVVKAPAGSKVRIRSGLNQVTLTF